MQLRLGAASTKQRQALLSGGAGEDLGKRMTKGTAHCGQVDVEKQMGGQTSIVLYDLIRVRMLGPREERPSLPP